MSAKAKHKHTAVGLVKAKGSVRKANDADEAFEVLKEHLDEISKSLNYENPDVIVNVANLIENLSPKILKSLKGEDKKALLIKLLQYRFGDLDGSAIGRISTVVDFVVSSGLVNKVSNAIKAKKGFAGLFGCLFA